MIRSKLVTTLALVGILTTAAACSSSSKTATSSASSASSSVAAPTGQPIRLGLITRTLYMDYLPQGAEAAIKRINDAGGIKGRPLELVKCQNDDKAAVAAACAQKFAADPTIIATVGDVNSFGADTNPPLEAAKVAGVGSSPLGAGDFASPRIFPSNSGGLEFLATAAYLYDELKARNIGMATIDTPTAQALPGLVNSNVLKSRGASLGATAAIPTTAADVSPQAAALSGSDGMALALSPDLGLRFIQSSRQQGYTGPILVSETSQFAADMQKALSPTDLDKVYGVTYFDKGSKGYANFTADMAKYEPSITPSDLNAIGWLSVGMFAHVAEGLATISREAVWDAMNKLSGYDTDGMTPNKLDYTTPGTALGGTAPRLVAPVLEVYVDVYKDGKWQPVSSSQKPIAVFS